MRGLPRRLGRLPGRLRRYHARAALTLIDALLDRFGAAYDTAKAERAAVDFDDLELRARDLLGGPGTRERWASGSS